MPENTTEYPTERFPTKSDLLGKVQRVEQNHITRKNTHELDHNLWRLEEYVLDEVKHDTLRQKHNYPSFTSNAPRTLSRVIMAMLNKNDIALKFLIPPNAGEDEQDKINYNEHLIRGAIYDADLVRQHNDKPNIQWALTWYITHRGGVAFLPLWVPEDKRNQWKISVIDPYEVAWERGDDCLGFFVRRYMDEEDSVRAEFHEMFEDGYKLKTNSQGQVEVLDIWWVEYEGHKVFNCVITTNEEWLKEPTHHPEFDCNPCYVKRAGGSPSDSDLSGKSATTNINTAIDDQWEGIYTGVRETIGWLNRAVSLFGIYLRNGAIGPYIYKGRKNKNIEKALKPFQVVKIDIGEDFGPTIQPQMAQEAKEFIEMIKGEWQKAGVSDIVFGDVPFTVSGFGMTQLRGAVEILISSYIGATENAYVLIANELTKQFVKLGRKRKVSIKGIDSRNKEFMEKITAKDIEKEYIITATLREGLPQDKVQLGNAANLWRQGGAPLEEVYENVFEFDDAQSVARKRRMEEAEAIPQVMLTKMLAAYLRAGQMEEAKILATLLQPQGPNAEAAQGQTSATTPSNALAQNQAQPSEAAGVGEQAGLFPQEPTGAPAGVRG